MDPDTISTIETAFSHISKGSQHLNQSQLEELLYVLGCKPLLSEPYFSEILMAFEKGKGITLDSLLAKLNDMTALKYSEPEIKEALAVFDEVGKGKVDKNELKRALTAYSNLPKADVDALLNTGQGDFVDINELLGTLLGKQHVKSPICRQIDITTLLLRRERELSFTKRYIHHSSSFSFYSVVLQVAYSFSSPQFICQITNLLRLFIRNFL
eukprot:TRINITY_DN1208_c0_g1_i1.p2 TRINITY_DN1208_c0_g1~~TRINITY_DN1208_c0_g1_i1.p2  ORF type:complete len:241 (-),score=10.37 TRINITY_DN1208_c0_g1_i1:1336-1971(-)